MTRGTSKAPELCRLMAYDAEGCWRELTTRAIDRGFPGLQTKRRIETMNRAICAAPRAARRWLASRNLMFDGNRRWRLRMQDGGASA